MAVCEDKIEMSAFGVMLIIFIITLIMIFHGKNSVPKYGGESQRFAVNWTLKIVFSYLINKELISISVPQHEEHMAPHPSPRNTHLQTHTSTGRTNILSHHYI